MRTSRHKRVKHQTSKIYPNRSWQPLRTSRTIMISAILSNPSHFIIAKHCPKCFLMMHSVPNRKVQLAPDITIRSQLKRPEPHIFEPSQVQEYKRPRLVGPLQCPLQIQCVCANDKTNRAPLRPQKLEEPLSSCLRRRPN